VQFVQGRAPLVIELPLPLPTVGELKRSVHAACGGAAAALSCAAKMCWLCVLHHS
jgi:hypothetical protein